MVNIGSLLAYDPTLAEADRIMEQEAAKRPPRSYLGASAIGHQCSRHLWYTLQPKITRKPFDAASLKRFEDGFHIEDVAIRRLLQVPGVEIWSRDENGQQIGGMLFGDKFGWHVDGVIVGILQAPKTPHILEIKCCNQEKFNKFKKIKANLGEKMTLAEWDPVYFAQAILYMGLLELTRHYLVVSTPGGREWDSCRTEENKPMAQQLLNKAERIINAKSEPERVSEDPSFWICKWCEFSEICHGS